MIDPIRRNSHATHFLRLPARPRRSLSAIALWWGVTDLKCGEKLARNAAMVPPRCRPRATHVPLKHRLHAARAALACPQPIHPCLTKVARLRPELSPIHPDVDLFATLGPIWPALAEFDRRWPLGPNLAGVGRISLHLASFARGWPDWACSGRASPTLGQTWPMYAQIGTNVRPKSATKMRPNSAMSTKLGP